MAWEKCIVNFCEKITHKDKNQLYGFKIHRGEKVCVVCNHNSEELVVKEGIYLCETINPKLKELSKIVISGIEYKLFTIIVIKKLEIKKRGIVKALIFQRVARMPEIFLEQTEEYNLVVYYNRVHKNCEIYSKDREALEHLSLILQNIFGTIIRENNYLSVSASNDRNFPQITEICLENFYDPEEIRKSTKVENKQR